MNRLPALCCALLFLLFAATGRAQDPPAAEDFVEEQLEADKPTAQEERLFTQMLRGSYPSDNPSSEALSAPAARKIMGNVLRWYLFRLTQERVQAAREGSVSAIMEEVLGGPGNSPTSKVFPPIRARQRGADADQEAQYRRQRDFVNILTAEAVPDIKKLLRNKSPMVRINAARVLERLAEWGRPEAADLLLLILENPKEHDAVRVWAIKGLGELLKEYVETGAFTERDSNGGKYRRAALAIYAWLAKNSSLAAEKVSTLTPEEQRAISFIRRQAMIALGNVQRPRLIDAPPGGGAPEGPVAELLVKIMDNNGVQPPADWAERIDAAIQLSRLKPALSPAYQPDFVLQRFASFISALGSEAASDGSRTKQRWKYTAVALKNAIDAMAAQLPSGSPGQKYLEKVQPRLIAVLEYLDDPGRNPQAARDLFIWLESNAAPNQGVFKPAPQ